MSRRRVEGSRAGATAGVEEVLADVSDPARPSEAGGGRSKASVEVIVELGV